MPKIIPISTPAPITYVLQSAKNFFSDLQIALRITRTGGITNSRRRFRIPSLRRVGTRIWRDYRVVEPGRGPCPACRGVRGTLTPHVHGGTSQASASPSARHASPVPASYVYGPGRESSRSGFYLPFYGRALSSRESITSHRGSDSGIGFA